VEAIFRHFTVSPMRHYLDIYHTALAIKEQCRVRELYVYYRVGSNRRNHCRNGRTNDHAD